MSVQLDKRFYEWNLWYINNVQRVSIVDPKLQWDFMTKAMAGLIEIFNAARYDIAVLEERASRLYRLSDVKVSGDLTRLG